MSSKDFGIQRHFHQKRQKRRRIRLFLYCSVAVVLFAALLYVPFFSGYFNVKNVSVSGTEAIPSESVRKTVTDMLDEPALLILARRSIFLFSTREAEQRLEKEFSRIETVSVSKRPFSREIAVAIVERQSAGIACGKNAGDACFYFDKNGALFAEAPFTVGASLLLVKEDALRPSELPHAQYTKEAVAFMFRIKEYARDFGGVTVESFSFLNHYGDVEALCVEGFKILFSMEQDGTKQAQVLKHLLAEEIKDNIAKLDYIDLRVENRAYYKLKK